VLHLSNVSESPYVATKINQNNKPNQTKIMKTINLNDRDQVKTSQDKFDSEFIVGSVEGQRMGKETSETALQRAIGFKHDLAWINMSGASLTADYKGKAEDMRKQREAYANAIVLDAGDHVIIEGREYTVKILANHESYSDGIQLVPFSNHPYVK